MHTVNKVSEAPYVKRSFVDGEPGSSRVKWDVQNSTNSSPSPCQINLADRLSVLSEYVIQITSNT